MTTHVHFVGSIGLETVEDVFASVGELVGPYVKRVPDGEVGSRRLWISYQYPFLRSSAYLTPDAARPAPGVGFYLLRIADGVKPEEIRFGELGYAREARISYIDFCRARNTGVLPRRTRFQVCLPTPMAVVGPFCIPEDAPKIEPAYERAMLREVETIAAAIPRHDLAIQWDVCIEMIMWDGRMPNMPRFPGIEQAFAARFARLAAAVPADVELGFHLCYGDLDAKHFIEPQDTSRIVELANLIAANAKRPISWLHLPVPIGRDDDAYFAPLEKLALGPATGTEIYLGLVHAKDGVAGAMRRIAAARRHMPEFGIATECGMARVRTPEVVKELLRVHAGAAQAASGQ
jgi:hypothetical protein